MKTLFAIAAFAAVLPLAAQAESNLNTGFPTGSPATATARLNFSITVPRVLYLQVGTGTPFTSNAAVDTISFAPTADQAINGGAVAGTGGDLSGGAVTVRVLSNVGDVALYNTVAGPLSTGIPAAPTIPWSAISVAAAQLTAGTTAGFTNGAITHPSFNTGASGGDSAKVTLTATSGVVKQEGKWTFTYNSATSVPAGSYGGGGSGNTGNGQVIYTASVNP